MTETVSILLQPPLDALFDSPPITLPSLNGTVLDVLQQICSGSERARTQILRETSLSPYVHVFLNGLPVPAAEVSQQPVAGGDELCLLTAIRGG
jgi:sulfur carrier protein ThiS